MAILGTPDLTVLFFTDVGYVRFHNTGSVCSIISYFNNLKQLEMKIFTMENIRKARQFVSGQTNHYLSQLYFTFLQIDGHEIKVLLGKFFYIFLYTIGPIE